MENLDDLRPRKNNREILSNHADIEHFARRVADAAGYCWAGLQMIDKDEDLTPDNRPLDEDGDLAPGHVQGEQIPPLGEYERQVISLCFHRGRYQPSVVQGGSVAVLRRALWDGYLIAQGATMQYWQFHFPA